VIFRTSEVVPLRVVDDAVEVRWAGPDDVPALNEINPDRRNHAELFEHGWECVIAHRAGKPVASLWFDPAECHASASNAFRFHRSPDSIWASYMCVRPEARLLGVFHRHWVETMKLLDDIGIRHIYHTSNADNEHSIRSHVRMGCRIIYHYRVLRLAGLVRHRAAPTEGEDLPASVGWGGWDLRAA
jgi:hypothetical protein